MNIRRPRPWHRVLTQSPGPPQPRCHGAGAAAVGTNQRAPRGDLPPRRVPCGSRPRLRRVISNPSFLRRYCSIPPPPLLGFLNGAGFHPVDATHPSAAIARAVARTADFSLDFLPRPARRCCWCLMSVMGVFSSDAGTCMPRSRSSAWG